jgi:cysteine-rich repeat protein
MHPRHRTLVLLALLGCKFDATGLGADSSGAAATSTSATSTGAAPIDTSTGVGPGAAPTSDPSASGSGSASDSATTTATATDTSGEPPKPVCGDGQISGDETCDDGNDNGPTRPCTSACAVNVCGDGFPLAGDEACDDGNADDGDGCRNDCTLPPGCGNGKIDDGEQCDDGNLVDTDGCIACKKAVCGDGYVQQNVESCDGGIETSECNADCSLAMCGDLKFNPSAGETCDLGPKNGIYDSGCAADCKGPGPTCGDGMVDAPDEKCEPAIPPPNSTCAATCQTISCADHHADCDQKLATGCEIDTDNDKNNCGECGKKCLVDCTDGGCSL